MDFLEDSKLARILEILIVFLLLVILGLLIKDVFFTSDCECESTTNLVSAIPDTEQEYEKDEKNIENGIVSEVLVDVKGAVKKPGVYRLSSDSVVNDAIELAGGLKSGASTKYINLSKKVLNEMVIMVYTSSEINKMNNNSLETCVVASENVKNCEGSSIVVTGDKNSNQVNDTNETINSNYKISINTASKDELMKLDGVGESKALAIIEYRNTNNGFKTLEELMNVSGIGDKAYNKIKDNIKL